VIENSHIVMEQQMRDAFGGDDVRWYEVTGWAGKHGSIEGARVSCGLIRPIQRVGGKEFVPQKSTFLSYNNYRMYRPTGSGEHKRFNATLKLHSGALGQLYDGDIEVEFTDIDYLIIRNQVLYTCRVDDEEQLPGRDGTLFVLDESHEFIPVAVYDNGHWMLPGNGQRYATTEFFTEEVQ
jgi:hypothetical protein